MAVRGFEFTPTQAMLEGTKLHEAQQAQIPTMEEYGEELFFRDFHAGKEISLKEVAVCNRLHGVRGHPDLTTFRKVIHPDRDEYFIHVTELKRGWFRRYILQGIAYGLIFSTPQCEVAVKVPMKRDPSRFKLTGRPLYDVSTKPFLINVALTLRIISGKRPRDISRLFMVNSALTPWAQGLVKGVLRMRRELLRFHRASIYSIENIPCCRTIRERCGYSVKPEEDEECPLWKRVCSRIPYRPKRKARQLYLGKRGLPVKTAPTLHLKAK